MSLLFLSLIAIPIISFILAFFIWKKSRLARILATLFILSVCSLAFVFVFLRGVSLLPLLLPALLGAVTLYYLWFDMRTAILFGSSIEAKPDLSQIKKDFSRMPGKVKLLLLLNVLPAILLVLLFVFAFVFLLALGKLDLNLYLFVVLLALIGLSLVVPYLIWIKSGIGRYLGIALAFLDLFGFPVGTALGIASLYLFFHPEVKSYFEKKG